MENNEKSGSFNLRRSLVVAGILGYLNSSAPYTFLGPVGIDKEVPFLQDQSLAKTDTCHHRKWSHYKRNSSRCELMHDDIGLGTQRDTIRPK